MLRQAQVFKQLPQRVGQLFGTHTLQLLGNISHNSIKVGMRIGPIKKSC